jgi:hypothetical protein
MIYYKTERQRNEFVDRIDARIRAVVLIFSGFAEMERGYDVIITDCLRTKKEDDKWGGVGIHVTGRAVDLNFCNNQKMRILDQGYADQLISQINNIIPYGSMRYKTVLYHDVGGGGHFHLQVNPTGLTTIRRFP